MQRIPYRYIIVDVETTGFSPTDNSIIELSAIKVEKDKIQKDGIFSCLVKQPFVPRNITELTGITTELLQREGIEPYNVMRSFSQYCQGYPILGWNVMFDISFLQTHFKKYLNQEYKPEYIDIMETVKLLEPYHTSYKLQSIAKDMNIEVKQAHRALADCATTFKIYKKVKETNKEKLPWFYETEEEI